MIAFHETKSVHGQIFILFVPIILRYVFTYKKEFNLDFVLSTDTSIIYKNDILIREKSSDSVLIYKKKNKLNSFRHLEMN